MLLCAYPSSCEVIVCWLGALPLVRGCGCKERSWVLLVIILPQILVEVPYVGVLCGQASGFEILLDKGGDVELGARTSKQILLFALDPLTLTLSLSLSLFVFTLCIDHIAISYTCLCVVAINFKFRI